VKIEAIAFTVRLFEAGDFRLMGAVGATAGE
jgi:hypothetical protein